MRIAIADDEQVYIDQLAAYLRQYAAEKKIDLQLETFLDGAQLLNGYTRRFDILLLDIEMKELNGMETARNVRAQDSDVVIVFITNMAQYAINGYEVGALDYILKPISYYTFSLRLERALSRVVKRQPEEILLNLPEGMQRIKISDILYIDVQKHTICYHTLTGVFSVRGSLASVQETLAGCPFVRCNHWYLVNLGHVSGIRGNLALVGKEELEISRRQKTAFLSALTDYMGMKA